MRERIAIVVADLSVGGVQRSAISIAEMLAGEHDVTMVSPSTTAELRPGGEVRLLSGEQSLGRDVVARFERQRWLGHALAELEPSVAVALTPGPATMTMAGLLGSRHRTQVVFAERNDYRVKIDRRSVRLARLAAYRWSDAVVVQTSALAEVVAERRQNRSVYVIPNALSRAFVGDDAPQAPRRHQVLFVGRLVPQKQADHAIAAFSAVAADHPSWTLEIVGNGPCRPALEHQAARSGFAERIRFHGVVSDPTEFYRSASVLLLTSRHEGFPNVLIEAMSFGVPVVSYACPSGPTEIVTHGRGGFLVGTGDVRSMAKHLDQLMSSAELVDEMGRLARDEVSVFTPERVGAQWRDLVADLASRRGSRLHLL